jgi:23S rRNA (uracil1939-C5)-methyltransferase
MNVRLRIDGMGARGDGLGQIDGARVAVPFALPGEIVQIERDGERGTLKCVETASEERIAPICGHFGTCGGCSVQHWRSNCVSEWKRERIAIALRRQKIEAEIRATLDAHGEGRRRVTLHIRPARAQTERTEAGFMQARSHLLVDLDHCPLLVPTLAPVPDIARQIGHILRGLGKPLDLQATACNQGLDLDLRGAGPIPDLFRQRLIALARDHDLARLTLHGERLIEARTPSLQVDNMMMALPPGSFLQATAAAEHILTDFALKAAEGAKHVADLFCGLGPFALRLSRHVKVKAHDSDRGAIEALQRSIRANPGGKPIIVEARDLFRRPLFAPELKPFDLALLDPPRQGAEQQMREIAKSRLQRVISISCDPESFARDARILIDAGFRLGPVTPVDQFRHSAHIEIMAVLSR